LPNSSFAILLIAIRNHKTLLKKIENIILNKQGIKMKEIRFFVYVLLCSLCLVNVDIAHNTEKQAIQPQCPTSPVMKKDHGTSPVKDDQENSGIIHDHGTTPVDLAASLARYPSSVCLNRAGSSTFSVDDLVALAAAAIHSPRKRALLEVPVNTFHGTTPVKNMNNCPHATSPVVGGKK
jgi:hypothetical protein